MGLRRAWTKLGVLYIGIRTILFAKYPIHPLGAILYAFEHTWLRFVFSVWDVMDMVQGLIPARPPWICDDTSPLTAPKLFTLEEYHARVMQEANPPTPAQKYQSLDGGGNNIEYPWIGQGGRPYGRCTPFNPRSNHPDLPNTSELFDLLIARDHFKAAPFGQNSIQVHIAICAIHDFFRSDVGRGEDGDGIVHELRNIHSSYLDLQTLYGYNEKVNSRVRLGQGGLLKSDAIADDRLEKLPGAKALLIAFSREHNYVATQLAERYPGRFSTDDELFYQARQIVIAVYHNVILRDYAGGILNVYAESGGPIVGLKLLRKFKDPKGFHTTMEFREMYVFHSIIPGSADPTAPIETDMDAAIKSMLAEPSGAFCSRNVPAFLKPFHEFDMRLCRSTGMCTSNQLRSVVGLKPLGFEDFHKDLQPVLRRLYKSADDIELFTGFAVEKQLPFGWGPPETIGRTILADAVASLANDRFATVNFTPEYYTEWGIEHACSTTLRELVMRHTSIKELPANICLPTVNGLHPREIARLNGTYGSRAGRFLAHMLRVVAMVLVVPLVAIVYPLLLVTVLPVRLLIRKIQGPPVKVLRPIKHKSTTASTVAGFAVPDEETGVKSTSKPERLPPYFVEPGSFSIVIAIVLVVLSFPIAAIYFASLFLRPRTTAIKAIACTKLWIWITFPKCTDWQGPGTTFFRFWILPLTIIEMGLLKKCVFPFDNQFHMLNKMSHMSHEIMGPSSVFAMAVVISDPESVQRHLNSEQKRDVTFFMGMRCIAPDCVSERMNVFSDGQALVKCRLVSASFLHHPSTINRFANIKSEVKDLIGDWLKQLPPNCKPIDTDMSLRIVSAFMFKILLGIDLTQKQIDRIVVLFSLGSSFTTLVSPMMDKFKLLRVSSHALKCRREFVKLLVNSEPMKDLIEKFKDSYSEGELYMIVGDLLVITGLRDGMTTTLPQLMNQTRFDRFRAKLYKSNPSAFIEETLRLSSPVACVPVVLQQPEKVVVMGREYTMPAGTTLALNFYEYNHNPHIFPDPEAFKLDRDFSKSLTFSGGERPCPGHKFVIALFTEVMSAFVSHCHPDLQ